MTINEYLSELLDDEKIQPEDKEKIKEKRDEVESLLRGEFGSKIKTVKYSGSIAKETAINSSKDIDLAVHFKKESYATLASMYEDVYDFLEKNYEVRKQKVSIGIPDFEVDVVPGRRISDKSEDNNVYLYRSDTDSRIKTNIETHKSHITESGCRDIIKIFKIWRDRWNLKFKSFALELLVIQALKDSSATSTKDKTKEVLEYIESNVESVNLIDPANSANNVADVIDSVKKSLMKSTAINCLSYIDESKGSIGVAEWKKVFNDFTHTENSSHNSDRPTVRRNMEDWGEQPERRYG
ncbi:hypothetical protein [Jeotgalibacillus sp. JSM ZJ347]|uniref:SMODS domain-containing nucleotidyltransferase n=1 Tax=Jeotgalibacillus sp. JSM ZJ347 TaxID=3342117 RepID=UPI0035A903F9